MDENELSVLSNQDFLLTKAAVVDKLTILLEKTETLLKGYFQSSTLSLPEGALAKAGKISKGENYLQLPYLILDYPRKFATEEIYAFRTMVWWGNFFSCTLHLQGKIWERKRETILKNITQLKNKEVFLCVNTTPWEYHYQSDNYLSLDQLQENEINEIIQNALFLKISRKLSLREWEQCPHFALETYQVLASVIK